MPHQQVAILHVEEIAGLPECDEVTTRHIAEHPELLIKAARELVRHYAMDGRNFSMEWAKHVVYGIASSATVRHEEECHLYGDPHPHGENTLAFRPGWKQVFTRLLAAEIRKRIRKRDGINLDLH